MASSYEPKVSRRRSAATAIGESLPSLGAPAVEASEVGNTMGSKNHSRWNVPGRRCSAPSNAAPPSEWPKPTPAPARPRASTTASTSSANAGQSYDRPSGVVASPWPRKSSARQWYAELRCAASGSNTRPWKPLAWARSSGGRPDPPRSWTATTTPSVEGTRCIWAILSASSAEADAVLAANRAFYEAFEQRDLDAMSEVWEHSDRVVCTHPGWTALRGWGAVAGSWFALFAGPTPLQFILTDVRAEVDGDTRGSRSTRTSSASASAAPWRP